MPASPYFIALLTILTALIGVGLTACGSGQAADKPRPAPPTPTAVASVAPTAVPVPCTDRTPNCAPPVTVAGRVALLWMAGNGPATLDHPTALALSPGGEIYVVDAGLARLAVFDRHGRFQRAWGSTGGDAGQFRFLASACPGGYHSEACSPRPGGGVATDEQGRAYVADFGNHRVQVFDPAGQFLTGWGREGVGPGQFQLPSGIAVDRQGQVYVSDGENHRVQVFDRDGRLLRAWGGLGPEEGRFRRPGAMALDGRGRLAVADLGNDRVQLFDLAGQFLAAWPTSFNALSGFGAAGLAFDTNGRLVVAGAEGDVRQLDKDGWPMRAWRADGFGQGFLVWPAAVAVDEEGDIYVADMGGDTVSKYRILTPATR